MRLICDTSVWYKLIDNPDWILRLKNHTLVSTHNSFFEITTSLNLLRQDKSERTIRALDLMSKNSEFIASNPWEFLISEDQLQNKWINSAFHDLGRLTLKPNINDINFDIEPIRSWTYERKEVTIKQSESFNELISKLKTDSFFNPWKREIDKLSKEYKTISTSYIEQQIKSFYDTDFIIQVNWENHEFFLTMLTNYIILLVKSNQKHKPNDIGDLYNMVYVKPNENFVTADKKTWLDISKTDINTKDRYIYLDSYMED